MKIKDVALLQPGSPDKFKDVNPIDISFGQPDAAASLFAMGYPLFGDQRTASLRFGSARLNGTPINGLLEVAQTTDKEAWRRASGPNGRERRLELVINKSTTESLEVCWPMQISQPYLRRSQSAVR